VKFQFIAAEKVHHALGLLCRCLRVTRSGFYAWQKRPASAHAKRDRQLKVLVRASFTASSTIGPALRRRREGQPARVVAIVDKAQQRLCRRFQRLTTDHHA
jgi:putative transposase